MTYGVWQWDPTQGLWLPTECASLDHAIALARELRDVDQDVFVGSSLVSPSWLARQLGYVWQDRKSVV